MKTTLLIALCLCSCRTLTLDEAKADFHDEVQHRREECFPGIMEAYEKAQRLASRHPDPAVFEDFIAEETQVMDMWRALCQTR